MSSSTLLTEATEESNENMEDTTWLIYLSNKLYHMYMTRVIYFGATTGLECFLPVPASYLTRLQYCLCTAAPQPPSVTYSRSQGCTTLNWTAEKVSNNQHCKGRAGSDKIPVPNLSRTFFSSSTRPVPTRKKKMTGYRVF